MKKFFQNNVWVGPLTLIGLACILLTIFGDIKEVNLSPILSFFNNFWIFFILGLVILAIVFIPRLLKTKIKFNRSWLLAIPVLALVYFIWFQWKSDEIKKEYYQPNVVINNSNRVDPLIGSPYLNMDGEKKNLMEKGQFFQFDVNWDEPRISFDPETSEKVVLYFQKAEDPTRHWRLYLWKNEQGEKQYLFSPRVPIDEALIGKTYVKAENKTAVVLVSRK